GAARSARIFISAAAPCGARASRVDAADAQARTHTSNTNFPRPVMYHPGMDQSSKAGVNLDRAERRRLASALLRQGNMLFTLPITLMLIGARARADEEGAQDAGTAERADRGAAGNARLV